MMRKYTVYFILITLVVILVNIYFSFSIYHRQISFQKSILAGQAEASADEIEKELMKFENEVNALLYSNIILGIDLSSDDINQAGIRSLEMLFSNNSNLIKNVHIYNLDGNVLNLSFNKRKNLLIDPYITQHAIPLSDKIAVSVSYTHLTLPTKRIV
jgi:hypothetical protein